MTTSPAVPVGSLEETDKLLHKFEIDNIPDQYRAYYGIKRNNFFASIQGSPTCGNTIYVSMPSECGNSPISSPVSAASC